MSKLVEDLDRRRLAAGLRALRKASGLSTTELARRLGCSQPKVSKTELGRTLPPPSDVDAWLRVTEADQATREELMAVADRVTGQFTEWRRALAPGRRRAQQDIQRMESAASVIRVFAPALVVGLAQTAAYADAVFRMGKQRGARDESIAEVVRARLARQAVLADGAKRFYLLMSEFSLRRRLISEPAMCEQLERLVTLSTCRNIAMSVIPFGAAERVHQYHGFSILGDPDADDEAIVRVSTVTRRITIRAPREIAEYIAHFEALRSAALEGESLRAFLREVIAELD